MFSIFTEDLSKDLKMIFTDISFVQEAAEKF